MKIDGLLLFDKSAGKSSNYELQQVKRLFEVKKAGHTGTLDPFATGLLPICIGQATKFAQYLLDAKKHYQAQACLGYQSSTGDIEGEITQCLVEEYPKESNVAEAVEKMQGESWQIPPMYSALKYNGKPLYEYARAGIRVERKKRAITVDKLSIESYVDNQLQLDILCSKGTYIRTLVEDIGAGLGTGAYTTELRRLGAGKFSHETMYTLQQLKDIKAASGLTGLYKVLLPVEQLVSSLPSVTLGLDLQLAIEHGKVITYSAELQSGLVALFGQTHGFLGVGAYDSGHLKAERLMVTNSTDNRANAKLAKDSSV